MLEVRIEKTRSEHNKSASLIGRLGSSAFSYPPLQCRCRSRARASLRNRHQGRSIMESEDEVEQSFTRPCRQTSGRSKRTCELTSSIVPRGTSFHCSVELEFPPIGFDPAGSCGCGVPGPPELGAVNPDAVQDHHRADASIIRRRHTSSSRTMASKRRCRATICSRSTRRTMSSGSTRTTKSGNSRPVP